MEKKGRVADMGGRSSPARILLLGYGVRGRQWARAVADSTEATLVGIVDPNPSAREDAPAPCFESANAALQVLHPAAMIVATPPALHAADTLLALEHGVPVLCEKPLTEDPAESVMLERAARRTGVPLLVGMNFRFVAASREYRRIVDEADLGSPLFGQFTYIRNRDGRRPDLNDFPLIMDQPMLFEQSIHHLDLLRYVYHREVIAVIARTWNPPTSVYRDDSCVAVLLEFAGGMQVSYLGTWTSGSNRLEFGWRTDFADGVVMQQEQFGGLFASRRDPEAGRSGPIFNDNIQPLGKLPIPTDRPFVDDTDRLLDHFIAVVSGRDRPDPSVSDHLHTVALLQACVASARGGRRMVVREVAEQMGIPLSRAESG